MKMDLLFTWGLSREVDQLKTGWIAIHTPLGGGKGYVLTDSRTKRCIARTEKKADAVKLRRRIEPLKDDPEAILQLLTEVEL